MADGVRGALAALLLLSALVGCGSGDDDGGPERAHELGSTRSTAADPSPAATSASGEARDGAPRALFFGDSYVVGGAYTGAENSMAAIAARRLGWRFRIAGGGGTGFVAANPEYDLPSYLGQIRDGALDVGPVDWLVIEGGGNDKGAPPAVVTRQAVRVLEAAEQRHPEARLVLVGTLDPTVDDFSDTDGVTAALAAAAATVGVPYVDAQHWLERRQELVGPDYDHPTPAGHRLCGHRLALALAALPGS